MDDTISRRAAIDAMKKQREELLKGLDKNSNVYGIISASTGIMICTVGQLPAAQPERKRGKWIDTGSNEEWYAREYRCSECGDTMLGEANFCPTCGSRNEVTDG